jgi:hypothetical protein
LVAAIVLAAMFWQSGWGLFGWYRQQREDWRNATAFVRSGTQADDKVITLPLYTRFTPELYLSQANVPETLMPVHSAAQLATAKRIWVMSTGYPKDLDTKALKSEQLANFREVSRRDFAGITVELYERK